MTAVLHFAGSHPMLPFHIISIESLDFSAGYIIMQMNLEGLHDSILYFKNDREIFNLFA